jgi:hypothetical protein
MHGTLRLENDGSGNCYGQYATIRVEGVPLALREQVIREFSYGFQNCRTLFNYDEIDKVLVAIGFTKTGTDAYKWSGVPEPAAPAEPALEVTVEAVDAEVEVEVEDPTLDVASPDEVTAETEGEVSADADLVVVDAPVADEATATPLDALGGSVEAAKKGNKGKR